MRRDGFSEDQTEPPNDYKLYETDVTALGNRRNSIDRPRFRIRAENSRSSNNVSASRNYFDIIQPVERNIWIGNRIATW